MDTHALTHTAASLAALHADNPRKLDALAAQVVLSHVVEWDVGIPYSVWPLIGYRPIPEYSADLNAVADLESRLAERGMEDHYGAALMDVLTDEFHPSVFYIATATATQRTIAAVLAAQEAK